MSEELYAKSDAQKKIMNPLKITLLLFHLVLCHHLMFVLYKNVTINNEQQKSCFELMGKGIYVRPQYWEISI